jgi:DNA-binding winged helix-turn-helix (wHTH) protein
VTDPPGTARERYRFADLRLDIPAALLTRADGEVVPLPLLSFELLVALVRRAPDVVSADELIGTVWAGLAVSDETLTQRVALLRRALGDDARQPRYLRAVRGHGYQLIPPLEAAAGGFHPDRLGPDAPCGGRRARGARRQPSRPPQPE